jgi:hypothetical protein
MSSSEPSLLSRWSQRKNQVQAEKDREALITDNLEIETNSLQSLDPSLPGTLPEIKDQELPPVLTDEDMPPIDSLHEDSDFSGFMSSGVSDKLRNMALKKMFNAPEFNIRDGLDEYDEDYTFFEKLGDIVTCDMKHQVEMQEKRKAEEEAKAEQEAKAALEAEEMSEANVSEDEEDESVEQIDGDSEQNDTAASKIESIESIPSDPISNEVAPNETSSKDGLVTMATENTLDKKY